MSLGGSGFGRAGGVFGRATLLEFRGWCRLRICRVLVSRLEIEKRFAMTKAPQDKSITLVSLGVNDQGGVGIKKRHLGSNFFFQQREVDLPTT